MLFGTFCFVTRGLEFHHQLNLDSFVFCTDETGQYVALQHETLQKHHQGGVDAHDSHTDKRMYATDNENCCPVDLQKLFISKTKNATNLFNQYIKDRLLDPDVWYSAKPLQKRTFSREIYIAVGTLPTVYEPLQSLTLIIMDLRHAILCSCRTTGIRVNRSLSSNQKKCISSTLLQWRLLHPHPLLQS